MGEQGGEEQGQADTLNGGAEDISRQRVREGEAKGEQGEADEGAGVGGGFGGGDG